MATESNNHPREGRIARRIETETSKLPSDVFLWAALGSMAVSAGFKFAKNKHTSLFIGQWAAPFLLLGIYNKLVKQHGHDSTSQY
jgi:hypothetical protein